MDNNETLDTILQINTQGIAESIITIFGEKHREKIADRIGNVTIFGAGSTDDALDCIDNTISMLNAWLQSLIAYSEKEQYDKYAPLIEQRIQKLTDVESELIIKSDIIAKSAAISDTLTKQKILNCKSKLSDRTRVLMQFAPKLDKDLSEFFQTEEDPKNMSIYYVDFFSKLLCLPQPYLRRWKTSKNVRTFN